MGLSLGAGGTAIGNSRWVSGGGTHIGLWQICVDDGDCDRTFEQDSYQDSRTYTLCTGYREFIILIMESEISV